MLKYGEIDNSYFVTVSYYVRAVICVTLVNYKFRVGLQAKTRKFHKSFKASSCSCYTKIKYSAARVVLYFMYSTRGNALTYAYSHYLI